MLYRVLSCMHLGALKPQWQDKNVSILMDAFEEHRADITVFLGDNFHDPNIHRAWYSTHYLLSLFDKIIDCAAATSKRVLVLMGNHDSKDSYFLDGYQKAEIYTKPIILSDLNLVLWPWQYEEFDREPLYTGGIFMGHVVWAEAPVYKDIKVSEAYNTWSTLELGSYDQALLGHYHFRYSEDTIHYVGQPWHTRVAPDKATQDKAVPGFALYDPEFVGPKWVDLNTIKLLTAWEESDYYQDDNVVWRVLYKTEKTDDIETIIVRDEDEEVDTTLLDKFHKPEEAWKVWAGDEAQNLQRLLDELQLSIEEGDSSQRRRLDKIKRIFLKNIGPHKELGVKPGDALAIMGKYGSGKSFIIESVLLALYGHAPRGPLSAMVSHEAPDASIVLELEVDGKPCVIERKIKMGKRPKSKLTVVYDGKEIPNPKDWIELSFGDISFVEALWFVHQERFGSLSYQKPADRVNFLSTLLDLDRYSKTYDKIKQVRRDTEAVIKNNKNTLQQVAKELENIPSVEDLEAAIKEIEEGKTASARKVGELNKELADLEAEIKWIEATLEKLSKTTIKQFDLDADKVLNMIQAKAASVKAKLEPIQNMNKMKDQVEAYKIDHCNGCLLYKEFKKQISDNSSELQKKLEAELDDYNKSIRDLVMFSRQMGEFDDWTGVSSRFGIRAGSIDDLFHTLSQALDDYEDRVLEITAELENISKTVDTKYDPKILLGKRMQLERLKGKLERETEELEKNLLKLKPLEKFFSPEGLPHQAMKALVPTLNSYVSDAIVEIGTHVNVKFVETTLRGGKIGIDLLTSIRGYDQKVELCSPGERTMVDIIVRTALMKLLGVSRVIIADELTERLSDDVKMEVMETIRSLVEQAVIVTHDDVTLGFEVLRL